MSTKNLLHLICISMLLGIILSGCSDDNDYLGPSPKSVNAAYFSGGSASGNDLKLLYSGKEWDGKETRFQTSDGVKATITLKNVIPGEEYTSFEVSLTPSTDSYTFNGFTTTPSGNGLSYDGNVRASLLTLSIQVLQPTNSLVGAWGLASVDINPETNEMRSMPLHITWEANGESATAATQLGILLSTIGSAYLQQYLQAVTFGDDGNITALYKNRLPEATWVQSPLNLCISYMKNGKLYVSPDLRIITALVQQNKALQQSATQKSAIGRTDTREINIMDILSLLSQVLQWGQEGIPFQVRDNANGTVSLFMDQSTIGPVLAILPTLIDYLPLDDEMAETIGELVGQIAAILPYTTRLEVGIDISK